MKNNQRNANFAVYFYANDPFLIQLNLFLLFYVQLLKNE